MNFTRLIRQFFMLGIDNRFDEEDENLLKDLCIGVALTLEEIDFVIPQNFYVEFDNNEIVAGIDITEDNIRLVFNKEEYLRIMTDHEIHVSKEILKFLVLHELRHVDQFNKNHAIYGEDDYFYWMGVKYPSGCGHGNAHYILPWEIDCNAYALSKCDISLVQNYWLYKEISSVNVDMKVAY